MARFRIGNATVTKIPELALDAFTPADLLADADRVLAARAASALGPGSVDRTTGTLRQSIHSWLVRTPDRVILVDTATGNDKKRPAVPVLNELREPYLERLAAAGITPERVDAVVMTHVHADHVGWNTRLDDGRWVPTFPNATYYLSGLEADYSAARAEGDDAAVSGLLAEAGLGTPLHPPAPGIFEDSIAPVIAAGLTRRVAVDGSEPLAGFRYVATPGHSIDHASVLFEDAGERALFWGDVLHHPVQLADLSWNSVFCEFPKAARASRRRALDLAAETGALVLTSHFAESSAGRVRRGGNGYAWSFDAGEVL